MKFTNKYNLPEYLVKLLSKDYPPKEGRISITQLIDEPLIRTLKIKYYDDLVVDVSRRLAFIKGNALHQYLEGHADDDEYAEIKQEDKIGNWTIVGKADNYNEQIKTIVDYKRSKVWSVIFKDTPDSQIKKYELQLQCYCWQWRRRGFEVEKMYLDLFLDDFSLAKAKQGGNYPKIGFVRLPVKVWSFEKQDRYIKQRLAEFENHPMRECSASSKWQKETKWAVMRVGQKNALRGSISNTRKEAEKFKAAHKNKTNLYIEERKGECVRCNYYCEVAQKCPFFVAGK